MSTPTLVLQINGLGVIDVSGYGLFFGSGTTSTIPLGAVGETVFMTALTGPEPLYVFEGWSGAGSSSTPDTRTVQADYVMVYTVQADFTGADERPGAGPCCTVGAIYSRAPPEPTSESVRIAALRECVAQQALPPGFVNCAPCRPDPEPRRRYTTLGERDRLLHQLSRCAFYRQNPHTGGLCPGQRETAHVTDRRASTAPGAPHLEVTLPHAIHQYRTHPRIRGIEEIAHVVRTTAAGELTARRRTAVETAAARAVRHGEHFRTHPPPPPCRLFTQGPQPGVPYRAQPTPCIPGQQRVDYSNPIAK